MLKRKPFVFVLGLLAFGLFAVFGASSVVAQGLPSGMIFFVATENCPSGTSPATDAAGRILVVTTDTSQIGKTYGTPMADQKDNTHTHAGSMTVNLPENDIAGASSCCNGQATTKGAHTATLTSASSTTDLPFIQLLVCVVN
jgi:hypothetical protein